MNTCIVGLPAESTTHRKEGRKEEKRNRNDDDKE
jgi:hypothetical protein